MNNLKIRGHPPAGFTLVEIMIVVAIIGLILAMALPNMIKARQITQTNCCMNNLRIIDDAKSRWALGFGHGTGDAVASSDVQPYLGHGISSVFPICPLGPGSYTIGSVGTNPLCSYAVDTNTHNAVLH